MRSRACPVSVSATSCPASFRIRTLLLSFAREGVGERLDGAHRDDPVDDPDRRIRRRILDPQGEPQPEAARVLVERDGSFVAAPGPGRLPPALVGLHEVLFEPRDPDREAVLVAEVHLRPGIGERNLRGEILLGRRREPEMALVHQERVHLLRRLLRVPELVVLHGREAHPLDHRGRLSPGAQDALLIPEPPLEGVANRDRLGHGAVRPGVVRCCARAAHVQHEPRAEQPGGQQRGDEGGSEQQAAERSISHWTGHRLDSFCFVVRPVAAVSFPVWRATIGVRGGSVATGEARAARPGRAERR